MTTRGYNDDQYIQALYKQVCKIENMFHEKQCHIEKQQIGYTSDRIYTIEP